MGAMPQGIGVPISMLSGMMPGMMGGMGQGLPINLMNAANMLPQSSLANPMAAMGAMGGVPGMPMMAASDPKNTQGLLRPPEKKKP